MPPRIRPRASKALKENIGITEKNTVKSVEKILRKVLSDKTNSASDENASVDVPKKITKNAKNLKKHEIQESRPRRDRRLPTRYVENNLLTNLSNCRERPKVPSVSKLDILSNIVDNSSKGDRPKSPPNEVQTDMKTSLVTNRPRRICQLPSRFDDNSISPNKYISLEPSHASTPIQQSKTKLLEKYEKSNEQSNKKELNTQISTNEIIPHIKPTRAAKKRALQIKLLESSNKTNNSESDTNNSAKVRPVQVKKTVKSIISENPSPSKITRKDKLWDKHFSFKVLKHVKSSNENNQSHFDVYEFTYDPNEEPKPQKKKRKNISRRPRKPKTTVFKSNYNQNMNKTLTSLKNVITKNNVVQTSKVMEGTENKVVTVPTSQSSAPYNNITRQSDVIVEKEKNDYIKNSTHENKHFSIRVEDIAADIQPSIEDHNSINYTPVNSPYHQNSTNAARSSSEKSTNVNDPLNLQEDFSFIDDEPVASSTMNMSTKHPLASPWRVDFENLPMRWHVNTYVKPNMTPAVESSFICSSDTIKKKHVYTNMVPQANDALPEIVTNSSNLKQTSIISFIKEVAEKNAKKKLRARSASPTKFNSIFDMPDLSNNDAKETDTNHAKKDLKDVTSDEDNIENVPNKRSKGKENYINTKKDGKKRKSIEIISDNQSQSKSMESPHKRKTKDATYFGFDDSANQEHENVSPLKDKNTNVRALRSRTRPALHELNDQTGPMRAALPIAAKNKKTTTSFEAVNKFNEELKSAADAPVFPEKERAVANMTNIDNNTVNDDSQSVHLFEDIEVIHHVKPSCKSYGKNKKVRFRPKSPSDSESHYNDAVEQKNSSGDDDDEIDDLADLTFEMPNVKDKKVTKRKKPKTLMSKKEEKEAEEWAADFNSMCEDVEEFPLLIE